MSKLNQNINIVMFDDTVASNNPQLKVVDWTQKFTGVPVQNPMSEHAMLSPSEVRTIFSGTRSLAIDNTTEFALSLSSLDSSVYRLKATNGTPPGFRTNRALALTGETLTVTVLNNAVATFELASMSVPTFTGVVVGDTVYVPGLTTGDAASPLGSLNEGYWTVIAVALRKLSLKRLPGESFTGAAGAFALSSNDQVQAFSSGPVQAGDTIAITAGFSPVTRGSYVITAVTHDMIEFSSTQPLPLEDDILPGSSGISVYSRSKSYVRIEVDQPTAVRFNGDTSDRYVLTPRAPGNPTGIAWLDWWGPVSDLTLVNKNTGELCHAVVLTAEEKSE